MKAAYLWLLLIYALMLVLVFRAGHEPYDPTLLDYHVLELEAGAIPGDILPAGNPEASAELRAYLETQGVELPPGGTIALGFGAFHFLNMESQQANIEAWLDRLVGRRNWRGPLPHYRLVFTLGTRELRITSDVTWVAEGGDGFKKQHYSRIFMGDPHGRSHLIFESPSIYLTTNNLSFTKPLWPLLALLTLAPTLVVFAIARPILYIARHSIDAWYVAITTRYH